MLESDRLTKAEIEAAVRILYEEGCFYHWWPIVTKSCEAFAASDRIGISELSGLVGRMLMAAAEARAQTDTA